MQGAYVLSMGGANIDISCRSAQPLIDADSNPGRIRSAPGGVARNVAENLARLGHTSRLLSVVGDDLAGQQLLQASRAAGVDVGACWVLPGEATASYVSVHGPDGELRVAVNDMQVLEQLTAQRLEQCRSLVEQATSLVIDANLPAAALQWLFGRRHAAPVFADAVSASKCRRLLPWLACIHALKVNRLELQALSGLPAQDATQCLAAARWLHEQGVRQVLLSLGADGLFWSAGDGTHGRLPALQVPVRNSSGAGDALLAGLVHGHHNRHSLAEAARFASGCAALTLTADAANHAGLSVAAVQALLDKSAPIIIPTSSTALPDRST